MPKKELPRILEEGQGREEGEEVMVYKTYDDRRKAFTKHDGENITITVKRVDTLRQGDSVKKIKYTTKHMGKVKNKVFYESGKRSPFSFMTAELVSVKPRRKK